MDKLEFRIEKRKIKDHEYNSVMIFINGRNFIEQLKDFETPMAKREGSGNIAGAYDGLTSSELYDSLCVKETASRRRILECECGCEGCWPFMIRVVEELDKIIWTDFEQPHRKREGTTFWDYSGLGNFTFNKDEYYGQIEKLKREK